MGIETQAVLTGHIGVEKLVSILEQYCNTRVVGSRDMQNQDYKIIEFLDQDLHRQAINVFLNSSAASDYTNLISGESTLITVEFSPSNFVIAQSLADVTGGFVKRADGDPWISH